MSFPPATEMVQFAGFASSSYGFTEGYPPRGVGCPIRRSEDPRALAPPLGFSQRATSFIASRCQGIHQMPFSSSSPTPSPKHAAKPRAENRGQTTEDRPRCRNSRPLFCSLVSVTWSLEPMRKHHRCLRIGAYIPMPRPSQTERLDLLHGHDSLHDVREQTTENRPHGPSCSFPVANSRSRSQKTGAKTVRSLSSVI
jgi:hypothetical protein